MDAELIDKYDIDSLSPTDAGLITVIHEAYKRGFSIASNFARENIAYVAMAASMQMITTKVTKDVYSREWRPTTMGLALLAEMELEDDNDE